MPLSRFSLVAAGALLLATAWGCGSGTAGIVAGGGDDGGGSANVASTISAFAIEDPKVSPTRVSFVLSDPEADAATVELSYQLAGATPKPLTQIAGVRKNPATLPTSAEGVEYELEWSFADEPDLPDDASYVSDIQVFGFVQGGVQEIQLGANATAIGLGNDPPEVTSAVVPIGEVDGIVGVALTIRDSSNDVVNVRAEYDVIGDVPDAGWRLARPALLDSRPEYAFEGVLAESVGSEIEFFWDTDVDLSELERDVRLRFTAVDPVVPGAALVTDSIHVDNNAAPIAVLHEGLLVTNSDQRRGIPIPFSVADDEGDGVEVVFQWRRPNEGFPDLPDTKEAIQEALEDPVQRRELHICSEYERVVEGRVVPVDATTIELPELASTAAVLLADGIVERELDILRASKRPLSVADRWSVNPFRNLVAALPVGEGLLAIAVEQPAAESWRAVEIELASGVVVRELATGIGAPRVAAWSRDARSILIVSSVASQWRLDRVDYASGEVTPLIAQGDVGPNGPIRGIASLGSSAALVTLGDALVRLDWADPRDLRAMTLADGLAMPWGVVLDPFQPERAYVAEHDGADANGIGRVVAIDLLTLVVEPIHATSIDGGAALPKPRDLALARDGSRLLAMCELDSEGGAHELRAVDLRAESPNTYGASDLFLSGARSLATGPYDLVIAAGAGGVGLYVGGGIEERRTIVAHDVARRRVEVSRELAPIPEPGAPWRITWSKGLVRASSGEAQVFLWDSADVLAGEVLLRVTPVDSEVGVASTSLANKQVQSPIGATRTQLIGSGPIVADLDGDGDLDLGFTASGSPYSFGVYFQTSAGVFEPQTTSVGSTPTFQNIGVFDAVDVDGDGNEDLLAHGNVDNVAFLGIFWQTTSGAWDPSPTVLSRSSPTPVVRSVQAADFDNDNDLDLLVLDDQLPGFTVYWQTDRRQFDPDPTLVPQDRTLIWNPLQVRAADIDADGHLELVATNFGLVSPITIYRQSSAGQFDATPMHVGNPTTAGSMIADVRIVDLNGDGRQDLVVLGGPHSIAVYWQGHAGEFEPEPQELAESAAFVGGDFDVLDVDSDGDLDLLVVDILGLQVLRQTSAGAFESTPVMMDIASEGQTLQSVIPADIDSDGDVDFVFEGFVGAAGFVPTIEVFWNTGAETIRSDPRPVIDSIEAGELTGGSLPLIWDAEPADLDGDGDLDVALVYGQGETSVLAVVWQSSGGVFERTPTVVCMRSMINVPRSVSVVDFDGDGDLDLVTANYSAHSLTVFLQTGPRQFSANPTVAPMNLPVGVRAADVDGDGRIDLVGQSASNSPAALYVFWQTGLARLDPTPTMVGQGGSLTINQGADALCIADIDRDGRLDLVAARGNLHVHLQSSPRIFESSVITHPGGAATSVQADDVDGDGDLDLVAGPQLTIYWQTSPGQFAESFALEAGVLAQIADIDGDGDLDLVSLGSLLTVYRQTRPGVFEPESRGIDFGIFNDFEALQTVDVDGDGSLDQLVLRDTIAGSRLDVFYGGH